RLHGGVQQLPVHRLPAAAGEDHARHAGLGRHHPGEPQDGGRAGGSVQQGAAIARASPCGGRAVAGDLAAVQGRSLMRRRAFWSTFAWPGIVWLILLFILPLYVVLALAFGTLDPLFLTPSPTWNPLQWDPTQFQYVFDHLFGADGFIGPVLVRTLVFVV